MGSFSTYLRAAGLLGLGSFVFAILYAAGRPLIDVHQSVAPSGSRLSFWTEQSLLWFPAFILGSLLVMVIASATLRRGI
jgi:hypothetical protein